MSNDAQVSKAQASDRETLNLFLRDARRHLDEAVLDLRRVAHELDIAGTLAGEGEVNAVQAALCQAFCRVFHTRDELDRIEVEQKQ